MHRPGANPSEMSAADFLCDFCGRSWEPTRPMIEGHHGSLICGDCLSVACVELDGARSPGTAVPPAITLTEAGPCTMCLEERADLAWRSPAREVAAICGRCIEMAAKQLGRDRNSGWQRPTRG